MNRILFALVLSFSCSAACAGIPSVTDNNHINCPKAGKLDATPAPAFPATTAITPAPQKSGGGLAIVHASPVIPTHVSAPRVISPRWHSFLPGMFR
ncbi:MAG TPA: hypothetical protein VKM00_01095 [Luteimonas sp.]|nr:hypothetical protein [Luteimonas sp.]